eukprot:m.157178 g.157178  ORF g.157178 m.157178 type:complete len:701 (+) comp14333_c0_seq1:111-2213(+)
MADPKRSVASLDDSDDDAPLAPPKVEDKPVSNVSPAKSAKRTASQAKGKATKTTKPVKEEAKAGPTAAKRSKAANGNAKKSSTPAEAERKRKPAKKTTAAAAKGKKGAAAGKKKAGSKKAGSATSSQNENGDADEEEEEDIFKWWEVPEHPEGIQWKTLEHNGPCFPPEYVPLPDNVHLLYDGVPYKLEPAAEEVATFYAQMLEREYIHKPQFNKNFMADWKTTMTPEEKKHIKSLSKCDFSIIHAHFCAQRDARKAATKEEKEQRKKETEAVKQEYGYCVIDGHRMPVGNFRIEPPGLFQGRGSHPKMGKLKRRVMPEQVIINIGEGATVPKPPAGHRWAEVRHDSKVTWLASWTENVQNQNKYVRLGNDSHVKGRSDLKKYETARMLKSHIDKIRADYTRDLKSKLMEERQRATALYFIDRLALRAGGEKDADEQADTVGCCSLRVEHVTAKPDDMIEFDFLGKDSIRYLNTVKVEHQVWKNIGHFQKNKEEGDDLFDRLNPPTLNAYLKTLMPDLTAKVFRTYNASITLQEQLKNTPVDGSVDEKMLAYQRANREVAVLCNHQRAPPKTHDQQMERLDGKIDDIREQLKASTKERRTLKAEARKMNEVPAKTLKKLESLKKKIATLEGRLKKQEIAKTDKAEGKTIALGTSKLNYLDPRISYAWCKKFGVPVTKVYNRTQRNKFVWANYLAEADFVF